MSRAMEQQAMEESPVRFITNPTISPTVGNSKGDSQPHISTNYPFTPERPFDIMDIQTDGGPGSGRYPKGSGKRIDPVQATPEQIKIYDKTLKGANTIVGVPVRTIEDHAYNRAVERGATPDEVAEALADPDIQLPGDRKRGNAPTFQKGRVKVAFDPKKDNIKTIIKD